MSLEFRKLTSNNLKRQLKNYFLGRARNENELQMDGLTTDIRIFMFIFYWG